MIFSFMSLHTSVRTVGIILGVMLLGGIGGVLVNNYVMPRFLALPWVAEKGWFDASAENTTVIQKTEEKIVREDDSLEKTFAQPAEAVVTIIYPARTTGKTVFPETDVPGFLVTNDGVIATYNVAGASLPTPRVILHNGEKHEVEPLGVDTYTNLVFYKLKKASNTPTVQFANSDDIRVGKKIVLLKNGVLANETMIDTQVMAGNESTLNLAAPLATSEKWEGVFALAASGGSRFVGAPAIAYSGEVIGMVGNIVDATGQTTDAFLLPGNAIKDALEKVVSGKLLEQAFLGTSYISLTQLSASQNSLAMEQGAYITDILPRSTVGSERFSAKKAGLKKGDIVTAVDDQKVDAYHPLSVLLYPKKKGDQTVLTVIRDGAETKITATFE
jgi:S1-C subfamily serine protease